MKNNPFIHKHRTKKKDKESNHKKSEKDNNKSNQKTNLTARKESFPHNKEREESFPNNEGLRKANKASEKFMARRETRASLTKG